MSFAQSDNSLGELNIELYINIELSNLKYAISIF